MFMSYKRLSQFVLLATAGSCRYPPAVEALRLLQLSWSLTGGRHIHRHRRHQHVQRWRNPPRSKGFRVVRVCGFQLLPWIRADAATTVVDMATFRRGEKTHTSLGRV
jgi:hypothetical protein